MVSLISLMNNIRQTRQTQQASDKIISVAPTATVGVSQRGKPLHHTELMTAALSRVSQDLKSAKKKKKSASSKRSHVFYSERN